MSVPIQFELRDNATASIQRKLDQCAPNRLGKIVGQPAATYLRRHLSSLPRNKRGWPSTGFYEEAADSVQFVPTDDGVIIRAEKQGLRQRWKGGEIKPQTRKHLAIPISPVSYGKSPKDFPGLFLLKTRVGAYLVQAGETFNARSGRFVGLRRAGGNTDRRRQAALNFLFKLSDGVVQEGDPKVMPTDDQFAEVAMAAVERSLK